MPHYLLAVHSDHCDTDDDTTAGGDATPEMPGAHPTEDEMAATMHRIEELESDMRSAGAFVFTGALTDPGSATVVRATSGESMSMTDGPYAEAKEHIAGFYVIDVPDLDAALAWAGRVVDCIKAPIEVRPFRHGMS